MPTIEDVVDIAEQAGRVVMRYYAQTDIAADRKQDDSPVTQADREADRFIRGKLRELSPHISCISEEHDIPEYDARKGWRRFWLVDPLDGTKEFLARNGEFTVNIALIEDNELVLGVVLAPALDVLYY